MRVRRDRSGIQFDRCPVRTLAYFPDALVVADYRGSGSCSLFHRAARRFGFDCGAELFELRACTGGLSPCGPGCAGL